MEFDNFIREKGICIRVNQWSGCFSGMDRNNNAIFVKRWWCSLKAFELLLNKLFKGGISLKVFHKIRQQFTEVVGCIRISKIWCRLQNPSRKGIDKFCYDYSLSSCVTELFVSKLVGESFLWVWIKAIKAIMQYLPCHQSLIFLFSCESL